MTLVDHDQSVYEQTDGNGRDARHDFDDESYEAAPTVLTELRKEDARADRDRNADEERKADHDSAPYECVVDATTGAARAIRIFGEEIQAQARQAFPQQVEQNEKKRHHGQADGDEHCGGHQPVDQFAAAVELLGTGKHE